MTILTTTFSIDRDLSTGKKYYTSIHNSKRYNTPNLPKDWQTTTQADTESPSYVIRCDSDLIVIDCDNEHSTKAIDSLLSSTEHYITVSDKGYKHYYFAPSEHYLSSLLYKDTRRAINTEDLAIDILHGRSLVFPACPLNHTKTVHQGTIDNLTTIPDQIVNYLLDNMKTATLTAHTDYKPITTFLAPNIEQALSLWARTKDYDKALQPLFSLITPAAYRDYTKPDYHPNRVPDGEGTNYLQAMTARIGQDYSISPELHTELITLIATELWDDPMSLSSLQAHLSNLTNQKYSDGSPVFTHKPEADSKILASLYKGPYSEIYHLQTGEYLVPIDGNPPAIFKTASLLKTVLSSQNCSLFIDGKTVTGPAVHQALKSRLDSIKTVALTNKPYKASGLFSENNIDYYNEYIPTKYLGIIRSEYLKERKASDRDFPTISKVYRNITKDHEDQDTLINKLHHFFSYKFKTLEHTEIIFQMIGNQGTGKDTWIDLILGGLCESVGTMNMNASNSQFNAGYAGRMIVKESESYVTPKLQESLKAFTGSKITSIEMKGKDPYHIRNISTPIVSSNMPVPLATNLEDRRVVMLASFTAKQLKVKSLDVAIAMELEAYSLYLRDLKTNNLDFYKNAKVWQDEQIREYFEDHSEESGDTVGMLASTIARIKMLSPTDLMEQLEHSLGTDFLFWCGYNDTVRIPLYKKGLQRNDGAQLTHHITKPQLERQQLKYCIKRVTNNKSGYTPNGFYTIELDLTPTQFELFKNKEDNIENISDSTIDLN